MSSHVPKNGPTEKPPETSILPEDADFSVLQQPINVGIKNIKQILKCIQGGSKEIKDILLNECNIIYECKVCQNFFRSLANFLYHKRCFCKEHVCESMVLFERFEEPQTVRVQSETVVDEQKEVDVTTIETKNDNMDVDEQLAPNESESAKSLPDNNLIPEAAVSSEVPEVSSTEDKSLKSPVANNSDDNKTETTPTKTVVSPIKIMGHTFLKLTMKDRLAEGCKNLEVRVLRKGKTEENPAIILKPIEGNKHAVFQNVEGKTEESSQPLSNDTSTVVFDSPVPKSSKTAASDSDSQSEIEIIKEVNVNEITKDKSSPASNGTSKNEAKKGKDIHLTRRKRLLKRTDCHVQTLKCLKCVTQFTTLKTLYSHMMSQHSQKRLYYPCPFCKTLFVQMYGVTRHLIAVHDKTKEQIDNKLREAIRKGAIWKGGNRSSVENNEETFEIENSETKESSKDSPSPVSSPEIKIDEKTFHSYVKVDKVLDIHQCSKCSRVFGRKSSQVSHQKFCIMNLPTKSESGSELSPSPVSSPVRPSYSPLKSQLSVVTKRLSFDDTKRTVRPKRGAEKQMHKDFVNSQTLKWRSANKIDTANKISTKAENRKVCQTFDRKIRAIVDIEKLSCLKCDRKFSSYSNLRRHCAIHIGWTRYECASCQYQSYTKSDCRHHIERMHNIPEADVEKHITHLVSDIIKDKIMNNTIKKSVVRKAKKKDFVNSKNKVVSKRKRVRRKSNSTSSSSNSSPVKQRTPLKKEIKEEPSVHEVRGLKKSKPIIVLKQPIKRPQGNYKSVTTNSPTTIILSKTGTNSTLAQLKASSDKSSLTPPKKFEVKFMTDTMSKPQFDPRNNVHFPSRIFSTGNSPVKPDIITLGNGLSNHDKSAVKKNRVISDWFVKKDRPGNMQFSNASPVKNESGPVIIDLVAAGNSPQRNKGQSTKTN